MYARIKHYFLCVVRACVFNVYVRMLNLLLDNRLTCVEMFSVCSKA